MNFFDGIKIVGKLIWFYEADKSKRVPVYLDPAFLGLVLSVLAMILAKFAGVDVDLKTQASVVTVITGVAGAFSPRVGVAPKPINSASVEQHTDMS